MLLTSFDAKLYLFILSIQLILAFKSFLSVDGGDSNSYLGYLDVSFLAAYAVGMFFRYDSRLLISWLPTVARVRFIKCYSCSLLRRMIVQNIIFFMICLRFLSGIPEYFCGKPLAVAYQTLLL